MKGGFLIPAIVGLDTRTTMDLDATIKGVDLTQEVLLNIFAEICEIQLEDDVTTGDKITPREIEYQLRWSEVD